MSHSPDSPFGCGRVWGPLETVIEPNGRLHICNKGERHSSSHVCKCGSRRPSNRLPVQPGERGPTITVPR